MLLVEPLPQSRVTCEQYLNDSISPGPVTHSLRKASTFWDCAFGVLGLTVVATRFSRAGDTFQRCPSSVTRLTVFLL